jgi:diguanylate cyclase (GGDEF)-like protein
MLFQVERVCLVLASLIAVAALCFSLFPALGQVLPSGWWWMGVPLACTALFCALSLLLSEPARQGRMAGLSKLFAILAGLIATFVLVAHVFQIHAGERRFLSVFQAASTPGRPTAAFALVALVLILIQSASPLIGRIANVLTSALCLVALLLVSEYIFGVLRLFGSPTSGPASPAILGCLALLTLAAALRQAEFGVFSVFLGCGIGSRTARILAPLLLVLPIALEAGKARISNSGLLAAPYATAILTAFASAISFALLLYLAWRINSMENEIHNLSLTDELTGLYNLRGFNLLAEHALRVARRSQLPFSVLFIDLVNLKLINDELGQGVGSAYLAETGELLKATFRDTDVKGRLGGDEFAVAGQFNRAGISVAAMRLEAASAALNAEARRQFPLRLSMGYITSEVDTQESLQELLSKADQAMVREKRQKTGRPN